jgi:hypothetical protein
MNASNRPTLIRPPSVKRQTFAVGLHQYLVSLAAVVVPGR